MRAQTRKLTFDDAVLRQAPTLLLFNLSGERSHDLFSPLLKVILEDGKRAFAGDVFGACTHELHFKLCGELLLLACLGDVEVKRVIFDRPVFISLACLEL